MIKDRVQSVEVADIYNSEGGDMIVEYYVGIGIHKYAYLLKCAVNGLDGLVPVLEVISVSFLEIIDSPAPYKDADVVELFQKYITEQREK